MSTAARPVGQEIRQQVGNVRIAQPTAAYSVTKKAVDIVLKAVLLGDINVGKSTFFRRMQFCETLVNRQVDVDTSWASQTIDLCTMIMDIDKTNVQVKIIINSQIPKSTVCSINTAW